MINLLPPQGLTFLKIEYRLRVSAVFMIMCGLAFLCIAIACIPTHVLVKAQIKGIDTTASNFQNQHKAIITLENEVKKTNTIITQLKKNPDTLNVGMLIEKINQLTSTTTPIKSYVMQYDSKTNIVTGIQIQGIASTRGDIMMLKRTLENSNTELFENIQVPISDLARDTNAPFTITINFKKNITHI